MNSFASVVSSGRQPSPSCPSTSLHVNHSKDATRNNTPGRELNLDLFGLEETSSIVETKELVDEILAFTTGRDLSLSRIFFNLVGELIPLVPLLPHHNDLALAIHSVGS